MTVNLIAQCHFFPLDKTVGFNLTEYRIPESLGYVDVCMMLYIPSGMDLVPFNVTVFLGFSKGNVYFCYCACTSPLDMGKW